MIEKLKAMLNDALEKIGNAKDQSELGELKANYLGKKSPLNEAMKQMGSMAPEERKTFGMKVNELKSKLEAKVNERRDTLQREAIEKKLQSEHKAYLYQTQ